MSKVVIIGGGIAGLSAGIFAQRNGFESVILEKNHNLGGECTGWDRNGYHIDGCIQWLVGTKKGTPIHDLWTIVGALDGVQIYNPESFLAFEHESGVTVHFYRDLALLRSSWLSISPQDEVAIHHFCDTIERLHSYEIPVEKPDDLMGLGEKIKFMIAMKDVGLVMQKFGKMSLKDYAKSFQHPALRETLSSFVPDGYSALSVFFALSSFTKDQASIPYGGSKQLALRMMERYLSLGGMVKTNCEVVAVSIDDKKVKQAVCSNGNSIEGDYFIAACDPSVLYQNLLKGNYSDPKFEKRYHNPVDYPLGSEIRIAIGYEGIMEDIPRSLRFPIAPIRINEEKIHMLTMTHYHYEPAFAPAGCTLITCSINQFHSDYDHWHALAKDVASYNQEKTRIGDEIIQAIEKRFSHMKGKLTLLDVATPKTFERYCNAYRGSFMAFLPTINGKMMSHTGEIKGLKNIFLSGQWLQPPGGLPVALITGKDTIMRLCKKEGRSFKK